MPAIWWSPAIRWSSTIRWSPANRWSIRSMDLHWWSCFKGRPQCRLQYSFNCFQEHSRWCWYSLNQKMIFDFEKCALSPSSVVREGLKWKYWHCQERRVDFEHAKIILWPNLSFLAANFCQKQGIENKRVLKNRAKSETYKVLRTQFWCHLSS